MHPKQTFDKSWVCRTENPPGADRLLNPRIQAPYWSGQYREVRQ